MNVLTEAEHNQAGGLRSLDLGLWTSSYLHKRTCLVAIDAWPAPRRVTTREVPRSVFMRRQLRLTTRFFAKQKLGK